MKKKKLITDRRLWLTAGRDQVVEDGDPAAAFLLVARPGREIPADVASRLKLRIVRGRIVYPDSPDIEEVEEAEVEAEEVEAGEDTGAATLRFGEGAQGDESEDESDDSDRNDDEPLEWTGRTSPEAYLKRYPTGPKAELAAAVIAANAGADGGS